jgi:hypothetical protein
MSPDYKRANPTVNVVDGFVGVVDVVLPSAVVVEEVGDIEFL